MVILLAQLPNYRWHYRCAPLCLASSIIFLNYLLSVPEGESLPLGITSGEDEGRGLLVFPAMMGYELHFLFILS